MDPASSPKKLLLVGHCGPDANYLRMTFRSALGEISLSYAEDNLSLDRAIEQGVDLILFNRELDYGFKPATGVEMIAELKSKHPNLKMILISNYPEVQSAAQAAGALAGFGKRELGSPRVKELLRIAAGLPPKP